MQKLVEHAETYFSIAAGTSGAAGNSGAAGSSTADAAIVARKKSRPELHNELLAAVDSKENETTEWPKDPSFAPLWTKEWHEPFQTVLGILGALNESFSVGGAADEASDEAANQLPTLIDSMRGYDDAVAVAVDDFHAFEPAKETGLALSETQQAGKGKRKSRGKTTDDNYADDSYYYALLQAQEVLLSSKLRSVLDDMDLHGATKTKGATLNLAHTLGFKNISKDWQNLEEGREIIASFIAVQFMNVSAGEGEGDVLPTTPTGARQSTWDKVETAARKQAKLSEHSQSFELYAKTFAAVRVYGMFVHQEVRAL